MFFGVSILRTAEGLGKDEEGFEFDCLIGRIGSLLLESRNGFFGGFE